MILAFNKPHGVLCQFTPGSTAVDGRSTLAEFIRTPNVYPAGRLDHDSEGLLILTDEGGVNHALTEPRAAHPRSYFAQVEGLPDDAALQQLARGVVLDGVMTRPARARRVDPPAWLWPRVPPIRVRKSIPDSWIEIALTEGRNRQVRRMTAAVGHPTLRLIRVKIGNYALGDLAPGQSRELDAAARAQLLGKPGAGTRG